MRPATSRLSADDSMAPMSYGKMILTGISIEDKLWRQCSWLWHCCAKASYRIWAGIWVGIMPRCQITFDIQLAIDHSYILYKNSLIEWIIDWIIECWKNYFKKPCDRQWTKFCYFSYVFFVISKQIQIMESYIPSNTTKLWIKSIILSPKYFDI